MVKFFSVDYCAVVARCGCSLEGRNKITSGFIKIIGDSGLVSFGEF